MESLSNSLGKCSKGLPGKLLNDSPSPRPKRGWFSRVLGESIVPPLLEPGAKATSGSKLWSGSDMPEEDRDTIEVVLFKSSGLNDSFN